MTNLEMELAKHTKKELAGMVVDLVDGQDANDIRHMTGLPIDRCEEITEAGHSLTVVWS